MANNHRSVVMLIDYDNVESAVRQEGVAGVIHRILHLLPEDVLSPVTHVAARLYGGWYNERLLTEAAQKLRGDIEHHFPFVVPLLTPGRRSGILVSAELALALSISPNVHLMNTYRIRSAPRNLRAEDYPFAKCVSPTAGCPLHATHHLLTTNRCPEPGCPVRIREVITRPEQKLVDTMLTADLVYVARRPSTVIVASSDDDLWPAIHTAVHLGTTIHHVHPIGGRRTPDIYAATVEKNYFQYSF